MSVRLRTSTFPPRRRGSRSTPRWPITGFELFSTTDGNQLAAYAGGGGTGARVGVFSKIEKNGGSTGIAFVNTEATAASVTLTAYHDNGNAVGTPQVFPGPRVVPRWSIPQRISSSRRISAALPTLLIHRIGMLWAFSSTAAWTNMMLDGLPGM